MIKMTATAQNEKFDTSKTVGIEPVAPLSDHDVVAEKEVAKGADALLAYADPSGTVIIDEATNRRLVRKIDTHVLPWLCGLYVLQYLDKGV